MVEANGGSEQLRDSLEEMFVAEKVRQQESGRHGEIQGGGEVTN